MARCLSPKEREAFLDLSLRVAPDVEAERARGRAFPEVVGEWSLLRSLRAAAGDSARAAAQFRDALAIRDAMGAHLVRQRLVAKDPDDYLSYGRLPHADRVLPVWAEHLPTGTADKDGHVVVYLSRALVRSFDGLKRAVSPPDFLAFRLARDVQMQLLLDARSRRAGKLALLTTVVDLAGISAAELVYHGSAPSVARYRGSYDTKESFTVFPETGGRVFLINCPMGVASAFAVLKALLPERTTAKFALMGKKYQGTLVEHVGKEGLPRVWGGDAEVATVESHVVAPRARGRPGVAGGTPPPVSRQASPGGSVFGWKLRRASSDSGDISESSESISSHDRGDADPWGDKAGAGQSQAVTRPRARLAWWRSSA